MVVWPMGEARGGAVVCSVAQAHCGCGCAPALALPWRDW